MPEGSYFAGLFTRTGWELCRMLYAGVPWIIPLAAIAFVAFNLGTWHERRAQLRD